MHYPINQSVFKVIVRQQHVVVLWVVCPQLLGAVTSWSLCWFLGKLTLSTRLEEVISPSQKIVQHFTSIKSQHIVFTLDSLQFFYISNKHDIMCELAFLVVLAGLLSLDRVRLALPPVSSLCSKLRLLIAGRSFIFTVQT